MATTVRELVAKFKFDFDKRGVQGFKGSMDKAVNGVKAFAAAVAGAAIVRGVANFINEVIRAGDEVDKLSKSIGINREALQEWQFAASLAGVDGKAFGLSLRKLQKNAVDAADGSTEMAKDFQRLGVSVKDANGQFKTGEQLLIEMADGMVRLETDTERVGIAQNLLGRAGPRMLALFEDGSEGMAAMREEARQLGGVMEEDLVDASVELVDDLTRLDFAMTGIRNGIARAVIPIVDRVVNAFTGMAKVVARISKETNFFNAAAILLATGGLVGLLALLLKFAGPLALFGKFFLVALAMVAVFDELITTWQGGDTVLRDLIDSLLGVGATEEGVRKLKDQFELTRQGMEMFGAAAFDAKDALIEAWSEAEVWWEGFTERFTTLFQGAQDELSMGFDRWLENLRETLRDIGGTLREIGQFLGVVDDPQPGQPVPREVPDADVDLRTGRGGRPAERPAGRGRRGRRGRRQRPRRAPVATDDAGLPVSRRGGRRGPQGRVLPVRIGVAQLGPPASSSRSVTQSNSVTVNVQGNADRSTAGKIASEVRKEMNKQSRQLLESQRTEVPSGSG